MGKAASLALALVGCLILAGLGLVAYSYLNTKVSLQSVSFSGIAWHPSVTSAVKGVIDVIAGSPANAILDQVDGVNLDAVVQANNQGAIAVQLPTLRYSLSINDVVVKQDWYVINESVAPGEIKEMHVPVTIDKANILAAGESIIRSEGIIDIQLTGTSSYHLLGFSVPVPVHYQKKISLLDEAKKRLQSTTESTLQQPKPVFPTITLIQKREYKVSPNSTRTIHFDLACLSNVSGSFFTGGGITNHVTIYIMTIDQAKLLESGSFTNWYYWSGDTYGGAIHAKMVPGSYYVVIKNGNNPDREKNVELELKGKCV